MKKLRESICFCTNIRRATGGIIEFYDKALRPSGLRVAQYTLLISLSLVEPIDTTSFAEYVGLERSTLIRNMQVLQKNGWVEDRPVGIKHQFQLTTHGQSILKQAIPLWEKAQNQFTEHMGENDAKEFMRLMQKSQELKWSVESR